MTVLTDPAECGPVTLAFCQDVQAEAYDYPDELLRATRLARAVRGPDAPNCRRASRCAPRKKPLVVAGGGALYPEAEAELLAVSAKSAASDAETQAGKLAPPADHPAASRRDRRHRHRAPRMRSRRRPTSCSRSARVSGLHHRLLGAVQAGRRSSASTCSRSMPPSIARCRWSPTPARARARWTSALGDWRAPAPGPSAAEAVGANGWRSRRAIPRRQRLDADRRAGARRPACAQATPATSWSAPPAACPGNCTSFGRPRARSAITWNTAIPAWAMRSPAALGVKLAHPDREVIVVVGDGSYLMMNSEIATSVMLGLKLTIVVARQSRLRLHQPAAARDRRRIVQQSAARRAARGAARSRFRRARAQLGAHAVKVASIAELEAALAAARSATTTQVDRARHRSDRRHRRRRRLVGRRGAGLRPRPRSSRARQQYEEALASQRVGD